MYLLVGLLLPLFFLLPIGWANLLSVNLSGINLGIIFGFLHYLILGLLILNLENFSHKGNRRK
jgi:hypothetical protein